MSAMHTWMRCMFLATSAALAVSLCSSATAHADAIGICNGAGKVTVTIDPGPTSNTTVTVTAPDSVKVDLDPVVVCTALNEVVINGAPNINIVDYSGVFAGTVTANLDNGNDDFTANGAQPVIVNGGAGDDTLKGAAGKDTLRGEANNDTLTGNGDEDTVEGGDGADIVFGGGDANDVLDGGIGPPDTLTYLGVGTPVTVNLDAGAPAGTDSVTGFEIVTGGSDDDVLIGDGLPQTLAGGPGDDLLEGRGGADAIQGDGHDPGGGDTASFADHVTPVNGSVTGPAVAEDTVSGIESLTGGSNDDTLSGDGGPNTLRGLGGSDTLQGGAGIDLLDGGANGATGDTASYLERNTTVIASVGGGLPGEDTYTSIENITGGGGDDTLTGDGAVNRLTGGNGADTIAGGGDPGDILVGGGDLATDTLTYALVATPVVVNLGGVVPPSTDNVSQFENVIGGDNDDVLIGNGGGNVLSGGGGDDTLQGLGGLDTLNGGGDSLVGDTVTYAERATGVTVSVASGLAGEDTFTGIENLTGGDGEDTLTGDAGPNTLRGGPGSDTLQGGAGLDTLDGGTQGAVGDTASYAERNTNVTASVTGGLAGEDGYTSIENITGGAGDDILTGDAGPNRLSGGDGADTIVGGGDTGDTLIGGSDASVDTLTYAGVGVGTPVTVNLFGGAPAGTDTASQFEEVIGGDDNDTLIGDDDPNTLRGGLGADTLRGRGGADALFGDGGLDTASYSERNTTVTVVLPSGGEDTFADVENVIGGDEGDILIGDGADNVLSGGPGDDTLQGGGGNDTLNGGTHGAIGDTASYAERNTGVTASVAGGVPGEDGYTGIENITGGGGDDTLTGDGSPNRLNGGDGADTIFGGGDSGDTLVGGSDASTDTLTYAGVGTPVVVNLFGGAPASTDTVSQFEAVIGGDDNDTLIGDDAVNTLRGGLGLDTLQGRGGADLLFGDGGLDTASYAERNTPVTAVLPAGGEDSFTDVENLTGGSGADTLTGDGAGNVLNGGDGDDTLQGGGGMDTLNGGGEGAIGDTASYAERNTGVAASVTGGVAGEDGYSSIENITGGGGDDVLTGNASPNRLSGGNGADTIFGGGDTGDTLTGGSDASPDTLTYAGVGAGIVANLSGVGPVSTDTISEFENVIGGDGHDTLIGDGADNVLTGGVGDDTLQGGGGLDTLHGGVSTAVGDTASYAERATAVSVTLPGGLAGEDTFTGIENVTGGGGDDTLTGDGGVNKLLGGSGDDTLQGAGGIDALDGGDEGAVGDTASFAERNTGVTAFSATGMVGEDTFTEIENLTGSGGGDFLFGDGQANRLRGGDGADYLDGDPGTDLVEGGNGPDTVQGGTDTGDTLVGGSDAAIDTLRYDGAGPVVVNFAAAPPIPTDTATEFEDAVGSDGNDTLIGDDGPNSLTGGLGNDTLQGRGGADVLDGGADTAGDTASYAERVTDLVASVTGGVAGEDTFAGIENLTGGSGNDELTGNASPNTLNGGPGDDTLIGAGGVDQLNGDANAAVGDTASYAERATAVTATLPAGGEDVLGGVENLTGGSGDDILTGDANANRLRGGVGIDTLNGAGGPDTLDGGDGADKLDGGADADAVGGGNGNDTIRGGADSGDVLAGGADRDLLTYDGEPAVVVDLGGLVPAPAATDATSGIEDVIGGAGDDTITGDAVANSLNGGPGIDTVTYLGNSAGQGVTVSLDGVSNDGTAGGTEGDNVTGAENVTGGAGADLLKGSQGVNALRGVGGDDTIVGGGGSDQLDGGTGTDTVSYEDRGPAEGVSATLEGAGGSAGELDSITGFERLQGGAGDDSLTGSAGDDDIRGGLGADVVAGAAGNDAVVGDAGPDTLSGGAGSDGLTGGDGNDRLDGGSEPDAFSGGPGDDDISAFDGNAEDVSCGDGADRVDHDLSDTFSAGDCEAGVVLGFVPPPFTLDPRPRDRDRDGAFAGTDCNDLDPTIRPGGPDIPGDGIDQNCNGSDAAFPPITTEFRLSFEKAKTGTRIKVFELRRVPAGARIVITCKSPRAPRCVFASRSVTLKSKRSKFSIRGYFGDRPLSNGSTISVRVSSGKSIGRTIDVAIRKRTQNPRVARGCLALDGKTVAPCP